MTKSVRISVKPEIWDWALTESERDERELLKRFPTAAKWFKQEQDPTFRQLENMANFLRVPFGYLLLDTPPKNDAVAAEFRSISNKVPQMSKNLLDTILEMDRRRSWMGDYRRELGWSKLGIIEKFEQENIKDVVADARLAKALLGLEEDWYTKVRDLDHAFRFLRDKLEKAGVLVMRSGIVGTNTHRPLDINDFRAFLLYDDVAPLIFVNNNDSKAGKVFSLIHEYLHVLFEQEDIFLDPYLKTGSLETRINVLTAEVLMPREKIVTLWRAGTDVFALIESLSSIFKVSQLAMSIKLNSLGLINQRIVETIKAKSVQHFEKKAREGEEINFYTTYYSRVSMRFIESVIRSAESGDIAYTEAFSLLGIKGKTYDNIKAEVMPYG